MENEYYITRDRDGEFNLWKGRPAWSSIHGEWNGNGAVWVLRDFTTEAYKAITGGEYVFRGGPKAIYEYRHGTLWKVVDW